MPQISVIIPLYNKELQIAKTLDSILSQTFNDFEIIIVDDGSTDGSLEIVKKFSDPRIHLLHQKNAGVSAARNNGIIAASGEYIAFLDADDEWHPHYLATQTKMTEQYPECDVFACNYSFKDSSGNIRNTILNRIKFTSEIGILDNYFEVASYSNPPLWTSAIMVRKDAINNIGGFPLGVKSGEDLLTWAKLATRHKIAFCKKAMAYFFYDVCTFNDDQKERSVSHDDEVGKELISLWHDNRSNNLRKYISLWYKMRTRIYLSKGLKTKAFFECIKSLKYDFNAKNIIFLGLCFIPQCITTKLFAKFR